MISAKARNRKKITDGGTTDTSGARLRLKSLSNHVRQLPTAIQSTMATAGKRSVERLDGVVRSTLAHVLSVPARIGTGIDIVSMPIWQQV